MENMQNISLPGEISVTEEQMLASGNLGESAADAVAAEEAMKIGEAQDDRAPIPPAFIDTMWGRIYGQMIEEVIGRQQPN
jgi:hypothetical protein